MRIFKTKVFARFARSQRIRDRDLREAVERAGRGLIDADLGGGIIKQRVARAGQGRSAGFRVLLAFRSQDRAVFIYGFAKNERDNIDRSRMARSQLCADREGNRGRTFARGAGWQLKLKRRNRVG